MLILDELFAWNIIGDPSWHHALYAWNHGVDGGGFLFYATLWPVVHGSAGSVLLPRLISTVAYLLAAVVWWRALTRFIDTRWAALGILLVWLSSEFLLGYMYMIRFYALYLLLSALAVYTLIRTAERSWSRTTSIILLFLVNGGLVLTHIIGIVYSALVLGAWLLLVTWRRQLWTFALPIVASWSLLLLCRKALYYSSLSYGYPGAPHPRDVLRFYLKTSAAVPLVVLAMIGLFFALRDLRRRLQENGADSPAVLAPALCLVYLLSPVALYILCLVSKPVMTSRYLLPYSLSLGTLSAYALQGLAGLLQPRPLWAQRAAGVVLGVMILALHLLAIHRLPPVPYLDVATLSRTGRGIPVMIEDEEAFLQLEHYFPNAGQFLFVMAPKGINPGLMAVVSDQGYFRGHLFRADAFYPSHRTFDALDSVKNHAIPWNPQPDLCSMSPKAKVRVTDTDLTLYAVKNCY